MAEHRDELPPNMVKLGEALGLFNEDGTLKTLEQILEEEDHARSKK